MQWRFINMLGVGLGIAGLVCVSNASFADNAGTTIHNEYHNATIYNTGPQQQATDPNQEGIFVYRDPDSGDRVISVRSKLSQPQPAQPPMYLEPIIRP
ncbi:MAG: hypothetical protein IJS54_02210 [Desulfovibrio sp.]|nr:hypothetical protein [Desulfovibrio sp.]